MGGDTFSFAQALKHALRHEGAKFFMLDRIEEERKQMKRPDWPEIMLFMQTEVLSGSIFISTPEGRLLDELNGRITFGPENREKLSETN